MLRNVRLYVLCICAAVLGCDALPKIQFQLQSEIQREFHVTNALVMVIDTSNLVLAIFDDARSALDPTERAMFEEEVARYATLHYQKAKFKGVAVVVGRASRRGRDGDEEPTLFVPEYHPDGTVRMALFRRPQLARPVQRKP
jgi:hypothetical protein